MPGKTSVLLIDALNIVRRIFESLAGEPEDDMVPRAVQSSVASVRRGLRECGATHGLVVFDGGGRTWRHELFEPYKQNRKAHPEALARVVGEVRAGLEEQGLACFRKEGFEADDIIASVATRLDAGGVSVTILSKDKDFLQLVSDNVVLRDHFAREGENPVRDRRWVEEHYGVPHELFIDAMALIGDPVDNIPGVPGIGPKRAAQLLRRWGNLDRLIEKRTWIPGTIGNNLRRAAWEQLDLARKLFTLRTDIELGLKLSDIRLPADPGRDGRRVSDKDPLPEGSPD